MKKLFITLALILGLSSSAWASSRIRSDNLQLYIRGNSTVSDYSSHGVTDGTLTGTTYISTPWGSTALDFDGTDDKLAVGSVYNGIKSVSFWCNPDTTTEQFMELASGIDIDVASGTIGTTGWTSPIVYVNRSISSTLIADSWQYVTVTSATGINMNALNLGVETTNFGDTSLSEVRFYSVVLTLDEIDTLYQLNLPKLTASQQPYNTLPDVSDSSLKGAWLNRATQGAKDLSSNNRDGTATDIAWENVGGEFNNTTSVLDVGADTIYTGAETICMTINPAGAGETAYGRLISNGKTELSIYSPGTDKFIFLSDGSTSASSGAISYNQWQDVCVTRTSAGIANIYINGALSGTANQNSGTPTVGTGNVFIGNVHGNDKTFNGLIKNVRHYSEVKSASWISDEYAKMVPDDSLVLNVSSSGKDLSRYSTTLTATGAVLGGRGIIFANGGLAWSSITFTGYGYWYQTSGKWTHYYNNGTTTYTNGVATGSMPKAITATGFATTTATMDNIVLHNEVKSDDWIKDDYERSKIYY